MAQLTPFQVTSLTAFLSAPQSAPGLHKMPLALRRYAPPPASTPLRNVRCGLALLGPPPPPPEDEAGPNALAGPVNGRRGDPLRRLRVEGELRREMRENIAHQRMIGSYVGLRHAMGMPVRGQNTQTNAKTARKLNRVERHR
jgi:small subunit ribosomal protein S13